MRTTTTFIAGALVCGLVLSAAGPARAGRGGRPEFIRSAIAANSIDAIQAELERSEYLVCGACTDLVMPLVDHDDYRIRKAAGWWLVRRGISRQVFVNMLGRLGQPDSVKAAHAADVLGEFGYASAIPALSAALSNPIFDGDARAAMARALGSIGRPAGRAALVASLGAAEPQVKTASLAALRDLGGQTDAVAIEPLLHDGDEQVRAQAALTLGATRTMGGVAGLLAALASDPSANVRKKAAWALGELGAPAAQAGAGLQQAAASDGSPVVRSLAEAAIAKLTR